MTVYISAHSIDLAQCLSRWLAHCGLTIVSSWHAEPAIVREETKAQAAARVLEEIQAADGLVMIAANVSCTDGGRCFEAGYAVGLGKKIWLYGRRECGPLWHDSIPASDHMGELADIIRGENVDDQRGVRPQVGTEEQCPAT
jgi:nucleoside 2-deoxyribosyltransferase